MKMRSLVSCVSLFLISLVLSVSCANPGSQVSTQTGSSPAPGGEVIVRLGFSTWPGWFPWQVAQEEKIFAANNVSVDLKWFDGYLESISTLTAQQIEANSQTLNDTISSVSGGQIRW